MKTQKMSLKSIQKALTRDEMKKIMAGSGGCSWYCAGTYWEVQNFPSCQAAGCPGEVTPANCHCF